jgi:hypothetical protein
MSWSYSGNPAASALDEVRFLTRDTDSTATWTLQDAEILYATAKYPTNILLAAAVCAEAILGRFAQMYQSKHVGDLTLTVSNRHAQYLILAQQLRARANLAGVSIYAGGLSWTEKREQDADADRVAPAAKTDGMNNSAPLNTDPTTGI